MAKVLYHQKNLVIAEDDGGMVGIVAPAMSVGSTVGLDENFGRDLPRPVAQPKFKRTGGLMNDKLFWMIIKKHGEHVLLFACLVGVIISAVALLTRG